MRVIEADLVWHLYAFWKSHFFQSGMSQLYLIITCVQLQCDFKVFLSDVLFVTYCEPSYANFRSDTNYLKLTPNSLLQLLALLCNIESTTFIVVSTMYSTALW